MVYSGVHLIVGVPLTEKYIASFATNDDEEWGFNQSCADILQDDPEMEYPPELKTLMNIKKMGVYIVPHDMVDDDDTGEPISKIIGISVGEIENTRFCGNRANKSQFLNLAKFLKSKKVKSAMTTIKKKAPRFKDQVSVYYVPFDCDCCS